MNCNIHSLYLCVTDMSRAIKFYQLFFEQEPIVTDEIYSIFDVNGFRMGLFAYKKMNEDHVFGNNCLPSIEVENIDILMKKITGLKLCFPVTKINDNWVAEFVDSEGNHIELTAPVS